MKITLRKAHALQKELLNELRKLDFDTDVEITEFEDPETKITQAVDVFEDQLEKRKDLLDTMYVIRKEVAKANSEKGVDQMLADVARLDNEIGFYNRVVNLTEPRVNGDVLKGKLEKIRKRDDTGESRIYGRSPDTVTTHIFNSDELERFETDLTEAKKLKQSFQDKLLEVNFQTEIELGDNEEAVLRAANLI